MAVKARDGVDDRYVHQFHERSILDGNARSETVPSLRKGDVEELRFPLAPAAEQKRIADKLDTVLTRVDAVNTRLARVAPAQTLPPIRPRRRHLGAVDGGLEVGAVNETWRVIPLGKAPALKTTMVLASQSPRLCVPNAGGLSVLRCIRRYRHH